MSVNISRWNNLRIPHTRFAVVMVALTVLCGTSVACTDVEEIREQRYSMAYLMETGECPGCNLQGMDFTVLGGPGFNLSGANLRGANFEGLNLTEVNFSGADLRRANFKDAILTQTDFRGADLREANLEGANIDNALIDFAQLSGNAGTDNIYRLTPADVLDRRVRWLAIGFGTLFTIFFIPFLIKLNRQLNASRAEKLYQKGIKSLSNHHHQQAIAQFSQSISLRSATETVYFDRGCAFLTLGKLERAKVDIDHFLSTNASDKRLDALIVKGWIDIKQREYARALQQFNTTLHDYPNSAAAITGRGLARQQLGDFHGSLDDFSQAIECEPEWSTYLERGKLLILFGEYSRALDDLAKAGALRDTTAQVQYYRGLAHYYLGDRQAAKLQWQQILETQPSTMPQSDAVALKSAYLVRGLTYYQLGQHKAAIRDLLAALKLDLIDADVHRRLGVTRLTLGNAAA
ncbi:MAG: pentapeptide repeat-containing protein, partial [Cyanobacteria bacterium J06627_8]